MKNAQLIKQPFCYYSKHETPNRVTVVGEFKDGNFNFAVARCGSKDHFQKKHGRSLAIRRLEDGKIYHQVKGITEPSTRLFTIIAKGIAQEVSKNPQFI